MGYNGYTNCETGNRSHTSDHSRKHPSRAIADVIPILQHLRYQCYWPKARDSVHHRLVKLNTRVADSLILATFNLSLSVSGFLLLYTSHSAWLLVVCWVLLPPLLVITLFFWARDLRKTTRRQAIVALLLSMPVLVLEIWFFKHLNL